MRLQRCCPWTGAVSGMSRKREAESSAETEKGKPGAKRMPQPTPPAKNRPAARLRRLRKMSAAGRCPRTRTVRVLPCPQPPVHAVPVEGERRHAAGHAGMAGNMQPMRKADKYAGSAQIVPRMPGSIAACHGNCPQQPHRKELVCAHALAHGMGQTIGGGNNGKARRKGVGNSGSRREVAERRLKSIRSKFRADERAGRPAAGSAA